MKPPIVFFHNNCADGFTSAYIVYKLHPDWEFKGLTYGQDMSDIEDLTTGREVYLLDFSFLPDVFEKVLKVATHIYLIDHHKSAVERLTKFFSNELVTTHISMDKSGAVLTWEFFHAPKEKVPTLVLYVQDRDIWKFELPDSTGVAEYIFSKAYTFENWDELFRTPIDKMVEIGTALYNTKMKNIKEIIASDANKFVLNIGGFKFKAYNLPYFWSSDGANLIAKESEDAPFGAGFYLQPDGYVFSLRSIGEFDVAKIAEQYGGGGHKNASGFKIKSLSQLIK